MEDESFTILVVCQGNIHRSALAAALLSTWAGWYLTPETAARVLVGSAGLGAREGAPMEAPVLEIAAALGADASGHRARQITDELIASADLVLTASRRQRDDIIQRVPAALKYAFTVREAGRMITDEEIGPPPEPRSVKKLRSSVGALSSRRHVIPDANDDDIVDPQGRGAEAFEQMARQEVPALARVGALLFGMPRPDVVAYVEAAEHIESLPADR